MISESSRRTLYAMALIVGLLVGAASPEVAHAQAANRSTNPTDGNFLKVVGNVFGFCVGQHYSLEQVGKAYPDLASSAAGAEAYFHLSTAKVCDTAKDFLDQRTSAAVVDDFRKQTVKELEQLVDVSDRGVAEGFIAEVRGRAHWKIAQPFLSNILAVRYRDRPVGEVLDGHVRTVESDGDPKLMGTELSLSVPLSWAEKAGARPHIWKTWTSGNGTGTMTVQLMVRDLGFRPTEAELAELKTLPPSDMVPETDEVLGGGPFVLEGLSGMMARYRAVRQRLDVMVAQMGEMWMLVLPTGKMVIINCLAGAEEGNDAFLQARYEELSPVCELVVNSLVLPSQY